MKNRPMTLLLTVVISFMLITSPSNPVSATSAQQEKLLDQNIDSSTDQVRESIDGSPCGTPSVKDAENQKIEEELERFRQNNVEIHSPSGSITIQVNFHVINRGSSIANGNVPESTLDAQIRVLNDSFSGLTGGPNTPFRFVKASVTRTNNLAWYTMQHNSPEEREAKSIMRRGGANVLNFYTINSDRGWGTFPWNYTSDPCMDGVVCTFTMLPGGTAAPFNEGDIGVHEVGHWLGLRHTFERGCTSLNDEVDDTPAHLGFTAGCPVGRDSCPTLPGLDPIDNFMQNSSDACKSRFTNGQSARMDTMYNQYRQSSTPPQCPLASVAWVQPAELSWGPPNTLTAAGYAHNGAGGVELLWRDVTANGPWNAVPWKPTPNPADNTWSNTIPTSDRCHTYLVKVNYSGIQSPVFVYDGVESGHCNESVKIIWIQPQSTAGFGNPGSLIVAGSAKNAPPGTQVFVMYRDVTARSPWITHPYAPIPDSNDIWIMDIPNADFSHIYSVIGTYDVVSHSCTYSGNNSINWCP